MVVFLQLGWHYLLAQAVALAAVVTCNFVGTSLIFRGRRLARQSDPVGGLRMHPNELEQARACDTKTLAVVVPLFNEQEVLPEFHARLSAVLDGLDQGAQIIYVNDGSTDATPAIVRCLAEQDARVMLLDLSRTSARRSPSRLAWTTPTPMPSW
jgi:cellulose synthase/poly-beta-1,6-N-acetylglucosamine synthase-like glycosyltransferase